MIGTATGTTTRAATRGGGDGAKEKKQRENELTNCFEVFSYIGWAFSTGWSDQPVLKVNFGEAKRREAPTFSTGWWLQPVLKTLPLIPV